MRVDSAGIRRDRRQRDRERENLFSDGGLFRGTRGGESIFANEQNFFFFFFWGGV